jgi:hypothetical protein
LITGTFGHADRNAGGDSDRTADGNGDPDAE